MFFGGGGVGGVARHAASYWFLLEIYSLSSDFPFSPSKNIQLVSHESDVTYLAIRFFILFFPYGQSLILLGLAHVSSNPCRRTALPKASWFSCGSSDRVSKASHSSRVLPSHAINLSIILLFGKRSMNQSFIQGPFTKCLQQSEL